MASIGIVQLKYLDQDNSYRRQLAEWYNHNFKGCDRIKSITVPEGCESSRHLYVIAVENRDQLLLALNEHEIYPGVHYRDNTEYSMYSYGKGTCPNSHKFSESILSLPMHLQLSKMDIDYICNTVKKYA